MRNQFRRVLAAMSIFLLAFGAPLVQAADEPALVAVKRTFVDSSRPVKPAFQFPGTADRRIDVSVWYPQGAGASGAGKLPLIVYSHGTYGFPGNASHFVNDLVRGGYVVAAPAFPLTSRESFADIPMAVPADVANQPGDVSFVIDQLLADPELGQLIDGESIGIVGHSLGAVTGYFLTYGAQTRDPRITANALIGGGDPVQAVLSSNFGFVGVQHAAVPVPVLFLSAGYDVFAGLTGRPFAAYSRVEPPKQEILVRGGTHVWFRDGNDKHPEGRNPDCLFFEKNVPGMQVPGCGGPVELIDPEEQKAITRTALHNFFDAYLKSDPDALQALRSIHREYPAAELRFED